MSWSLFALVLLLAEFGETLWRTKGHYHARRMSYLLIVTLFFIGAQFYKHKIKSKKLPPNLLFKKIISLVIAYWCYKNFLDPKIIYLHHLWVKEIIRYSSLAIALFFIYFSYSSTQGKNNLLSKAIIPLFLFLFIFRLLCLYGSPEPIIDVFTSNSDAIKYLLEGINPYTQEYRDIYAGRYDYKPGLVYWPGIFLWQAPSFFLFKDVRAFFILAEIFILFGFHRILKQFNINQEVIFLLLLSWSFFPIQNFILEQSWIDPALIATTLWVFIFIQEKRWAMASIAIGIMVATKQYAIITALLLVPYLWKQLKFKKLFFFVILSVFSASVIILPFFIGASEQFINMTIKVPSLQAFRPDSYSLIAILWNNYPQINFLPLTWIIPLLSLVTFFIYSCFKPSMKGTIYSLFWCYYLTFLFGKQAFCNYYFFLMIFLYLILFFELKEEKITEQENCRPLFYKDLKELS